MLISLGTEQTISKIAMLIKGESSFANKQKLIKQKFENVVMNILRHSLANLAVDKVRQYIVNQDEHHKKKTFTEEYKEFLSIHGFSRSDFG
ncbi:MAG: hypothetical protein WKF59_12785 [Chitinophagaceae bacterium]